ncbi:MAG TPA: hypothetical protein VGG64_26215 [Pirellulales bacterium]|jgi:hypothetical protein
MDGDCDLVLPRPPRSKWFWPLVQVAIVLVVLGCAYGVVAFRYWNDRPKLTHNYAAEINQRILALPESERGWRRYLPILAELARDWPTEPWGGEPAEVLTREDVWSFVEAKRAILAQARELAELPALGYPLRDRATLEEAVSEHPELTRAQLEKSLQAPSENPCLIGVRLPFSTFTNLTCCLRAEAMLAGNRGNGRLAGDDLLAVMRLADQLRESEFLISDLAGARELSRALHSLGLLLELPTIPFSDDQLRKLEQGALAFGGGDIPLRVDGERLVFMDLVQRVYTDDGQGDGHMFAPAVEQALGGRDEPGWRMLILAPLTTGRFWSRRQVVDRYERLFKLWQECLATPILQIDKSPYFTELKRLKADKRNSLLTLMLFDSLGPALRRAQVRQQRDAILVVSAAARYRLAHGSWPKTIEELVPKFLARVPPDQLSDSPICYRLVDGSPVVYSRGADGEDDGGVPARLAGGAAVDFDQPSEPTRAWRWDNIEALDQQPRGDWVLWPITDRAEVPLEGAP